MKKVWKTRLDAARSEVSAKELLEHARLFLKLDIGYVAAAGAVFTALKLEIEDLLVNFDTFGFAPYAFTVLLLIDALVYGELYEKWIGTVRRHPLSGKVLLWLMRLQVPAHALFLLTLMTHFSGYASGAHDQIREYEAMARVQRGVDLAIQRTGKVPKSISELPAGGLYRDAVKKIGAANIRIIDRGGSEYELTFAGRDRQLGTADDETYTKAVSAVTIFEELWGRRQK